MESDKEISEKPPNPRANANFFTVLTFTWLIGIFYKGFKKDFEIEDLYEPLKEHKSSYLGDIFERYWEKEVINAKKCNRTPKFLNVILRAFWLKIFIYTIILSIGELVFRLSQPFFIGLIVRYFSVANDKLKEASDVDPTYMARLIEILGTQKSRITRNEAIFYAAGLVLTTLITTFFFHCVMLENFHQGMKIRVAACSQIYRKALKLSKVSLRGTTVGQLVNLLSNDVNRFDNSINALPYVLIIGPVQTILVTYFVYQVMGWSSFIGILFLLLHVPIHIYLGKKISDFRLKTSVKTDERIRFMNEIISGIQVIKMYAWEAPFSKLVALAREKEINEIWGSSFGRAILSSCLMFTTRISIFLTVVTYALLGNIISAEEVFVLIAFYNILRLTMTSSFPMGIAQGAEALMSVKRLQNFLLYEENPESINDHEKESLSKGEDNNSSLMIKFENVTCEWVKDREPTLNNISISISSGKLLAVIGQVGAGKSSLLNAILRELPVKSGKLIVNGTVSYACQESWLFSGSIRQNILFGTEYDPQRYKRVVEVCALKRDFELFPYGDKTIVGERGISLSKGQKARVNLARAVYKNADIYLLDDPLSAVDAHVGKHLFDECITTFLKGKTIILVTHQLQYLQGADQILVLHNGIVQSSGSFEELQKSGLDFAKLLHKPAVESEETQLKKVSAASDHNKRSSVISATSNTGDGNKEDPREVDEQRKRGALGWKTYIEYFAATKNYFLIFSMFSLFLLTQTTASAADYWASKWSSDEEINHSNLTNMTEEKLQQSTYENIYVYSGVSIATLFVALFRSFLFFKICLIASKNLHNDMFSNITCATMRFFHINPSGRILNRFSKDMGAGDELLPTSMADSLQIGLQLLGFIALVAVASPILLIPTAIICVIFYFLRMVYTTTSRSIKRLEGVTRSPVFSHLSASLQGLTTIRAFNAQKILQKEFDHHQDLHSTTWYIFLATARGFGFWLDLICTIFIAIITASFIFWVKESGANAGLAITQSIFITGLLQWGVRQSAEMENQMTSVERILEYSAVEKEPTFESKPNKKPLDSWPTAGAISFEKVVLKYDPTGKPVLHDVTFCINSKEKVGIVGRTGAGKSSLIAALFRLAYIEGKIIIDTVETSEIGLHDLRSKISIIPQDPVLFSGTLSKNLDPFDEYPDWLLWQALEEVELKEVVNGYSGGLDTKMAEGGTNFSVGQRQLVCLARAIIRNNKILIMDEATANVDPQTDILIQKTIRRKFNDCTVLTIAHRLNTVMDSDRILVMDAGQVVEFDHQYILLKNEKSLLNSMVEQTGAETSKKLKSIAKKSYKFKLHREATIRMGEEASFTSTKSTNIHNFGDQWEETRL